MFKRYIANIHVEIPIKATIVILNPCIEYMFSSTSSRENTQIYIYKYNMQSCVEHQTTFSGIYKWKFLSDFLTMNFRKVM